MRQSLGAAILNALLLTSLLTAGCSSIGDITGRYSDSGRQVRIVLEDGEGFCAEQSVYDVQEGDTVSISVQPLADWTILGCDYEGAVLSEGEEDGTVLLTLPEVRYSTVVSVKAQENPYCIRYHMGSDGESAAEVTYPARHLRINTAAGWELDSLFSADQKYLLCGWTTEAEGRGQRIGLGSRTEVPDDTALDLYADWRKISDPADFEYEKRPAGDAWITAYRGTDREIVIPPEIDGCRITGIAEGAFRGSDCESVVLSPTIRTVSLYAFSEASLSSLLFFDTVTDITDYAFADCPNLQTIRINAGQPPVYSGTYFDTFPDKMDRLFSLEGESKIVLFSGSSARFGYDSALLEEAFPDRKAVNMGVFAYTNALPQLELILGAVQEGDILIHSPEFDAVKRQFCTTNAFDENFFCMIESDYDLLQRLDYREYGGILSAFATFQKQRAGMEQRDYLESASQYDEDHERVSEPSYNAYGDYIVFRPNAQDDAPIYDLPVDYLAEAFPMEQVIKPLNQVYERFLENGVQVFFTYAPRNMLALSERSTERERARLDEWLRASLCVPVISPIEESLYPGRFLYGTDNHLSTEGVRIRTERIIEDLRKQIDGKEEDR